MKTARIVTALLGALVVPLATVFWVAEGARTSGAWVLSFGVGAALGVTLLTSRTSWARPGGWAALFLAGQGAVLALVDAGPEIHYQHLRFSAETWQPFGWPAALILLIQLGAVVRGAGPVLGGMRRFAQEHGAMWQWVLVVGTFVFTGAALSREPMLYASELMGAALFQLLALATLGAAVCSLTEAQAKRIGQGAAAVLESDRLKWGVAAWVFTASAALAVFVYQAHPHVPDEVVYLLHSRYFAAGMLDLPLPPVPAAFELDLMSATESRWFVPVPPGWPAALAVGVAFGMPWLINPLFGAASVLLVHALVKDLYGLKTAGAVTVLLGVSPWFLFLNMSLMTHSFTMFALAGAGLATSKCVQGRGVLWAVVAGLGIGVIALNRPLEGLIVAAVLGLWGLARGKRRVLNVGIMAVVSAAVVATTFPYNEHFTGDPLTFPIMSYMDQTYGEGSNSLGFGPEKGVGFGGLDPFPGHGPADAAVNTALNLFQINVELSGWASGSILPLALLILVFGGLVAADWALVGALGLVAAAHALYWFSGGPDFGARYWYLMLLPLLVLIVRAGVRFGDLTGRRHQVRSAFVLLCLGSLLVFVPWRATDKYWEYRGMRPDIRMMADEEQWGGNDVIFIRGERHPDYASAAVYNPLDLTGDGPIYAWARDESVEAEVRRAYEGRRFWSVDGSTVTGAGFAIRTRPGVN